MAKNKRKPSAAQRDKYSIEIAKILKKKGILSKSAKLHGGRFISRGVLAKVKELQFVAKPDYRALTVPRSFAKRAKEEGYQVVQGNKIIVPKDHDFIKRIKSGMIGGVRPVKGGEMIEVTLPFTADNIQGLIGKLQRGDLEDLKLPNESLAFSFHGNMSRRSFPTMARMREYLEHYKQDTQMKALKFFRLNPSDEEYFIYDREYREQRRKENAAKNTSQDRRGRGARTYSERMAFLDRVAPARAEKIRKANAEKYKKRMARLAADPAKLEAVKRATNERAKAHYHANKGRKKK